MQRNSWRIFLDKRKQVDKEAPGGLLEGSSTHHGVPGDPGVPWWVLPTSGAPWTTSSPYKFPNIPKPLG